MPSCACLVRQTSPQARTIASQCEILSVARRMWLPPLWQHTLRRTDGVSPQAQGKIHAMGAHLLRQVNARRSASVLQDSPETTASRGVATACHTVSSHRETRRRVLLEIVERDTCAVLSAAAGAPARTSLPIARCATLSMQRPGLVRQRQSCSPGSALSDTRHAPMIHHRPRSTGKSW